jgi:hypothetical protein
MSAKTLKRAPEDAADDETSGNINLDNFLAAGMHGAYKRPWHRLERGLRLNRLRAFVDEEATRVILSEAEASQLLTLLQKALDRKMLNSKTMVIYDQEEEKIKEIKTLVSHRGADGVTRYGFAEKRVTQTLRRKRDEVAPPKN